MVEKARHIHESLRQDEDINLDENWDEEVKEESYFDADDMGDEEHHDDADMDTSAEGDVDVDADMGDGDMDVDVDSDMDGDMDDVDVDMDGDEGGESDIADLKAKAEDIEAQIHELTAEFERMMGDEGVGDDDMEGDEFETSDDGEEDFDDLEDEEPDLADRMDTDMSSEDGEDPEHDETMESAEGDDDDMIEEDENLDDITESVLAELDKIASPGNTDGKEIGSGGKTVAGNKKSMLPNHGVNDRIAGAKPYMVKGGNNDSFARETPPSSKGVDTLVKGAKNSMARSDSKFEKKSKEGDASAKINSDFAGGGEAKGKSIVGDGSPTKPKTR